MQLLLLILFFLSTLGYILFLLKWTSWRVEILPLVTVLSQIILLYFASLLNLLQVIAYSLHISGIILLFFLLFTHRRDIKGLVAKSVTPGFVFFWLFALFFWATTRYLIFINNDEFSHWGLIYKVLNLTNQLPNYPSALLFPHYPPGTALYQYFVAKLAGSTEGSAYFATNLFILAVVFSFLPSLSWKQFIRALTTFVSALLIFYLFGYQMNTMLVDGLLGLLFGAGVYFGWNYDRRDGSSLTVVTLISSVLPLIKDSGMLFSIMIVTIFLISGLNRWWLIVSVNGDFHTGAVHDLFIKLLSNFYRSRQFIGLIFILLSPFVIYSSWSLHKADIGLPKKFDLSRITLTEVYTAFYKNPTEKDRAVISTFVSGVESRPIGFSTLSVKNLVVFFGVLTGFFYFVTLMEDNDFRSSFIRLQLLLFLFCLIYLVALLLNYLYYFTEYEAKLIAGYERYIGSFILGWFLVLYRSIQDFNKVSHKFNHSTRNVSLITFYLLSVLVFIKVPPSSYLYVIKGSEEREKAHSIFIKYNGIEPDANIYHIWQSSIGIEHYMMRYELAPRITQFWGWSILPEGGYYEQDVWTVHYTPEQWFSLLQKNKFDYVLLSYSDERFWNEYGKLFNTFDGKGSPQLFKVTNEGLIRVD